ncbi:MAG TPA: LPXTG cell wall anchor domain-containing protein [Chitinophagaceae bacterium]|nr:LPXTG cell wall anchor domain-containing protein [Chitinophagaceae bacterium]
MRNKLFYKTTITIIAVFFSLLAAAQSKTTVKATIDRSQILIGEPVRLTLEADIPEHEAIRFFQYDSIPHFEFLNKQKIDTSNTGSGTVLTQIIQITSWDSGHWVIPSFRLGENIATDTLPIDVGFSPFNPEQPYHDTKDIIEVTPEEEKEKERWWYIVGGAVLLLLLLIFLLKKKKKPVVPVVEQPLDPYRDAIKQLEKLQREKPETKQYYSRLVDIFKEYIAAKKGIHSLQATTYDLVAQLKGLNMPADQFDELARSLSLSDFVKFAKYIPSTEDDKNVLTIIYRSIQQIEQEQ